MNQDVLGTAIGAILTLLVFSYLIHDTFLFRLAQAIFVGVAVGYGATVIIHNVILKSIFDPFVVALNQGLMARVGVFEAGAVFELIGFVLTFLLGFFLIVFNIIKRGEFASVVGNIPLAYMFGIGAALALTGALAGTLGPQFLATMNALAANRASLFDLLNGLIILIGTVGALLAFRYTIDIQQASAKGFVTVARVWGRIGRGFIFIALGALFAGVLVARVSVLISQIYFLIHDVPAVLFK